LFHTNQPSGSTSYKYSIQQTSSQKNLSKMKRIFSYLTAIAAVVILLAACQKNKNEVVIPDAPGASNNRQEEYKPGAGGVSQEIFTTLPFSKNAQKVTVNLIDDLQIMEGDIILKPTTPSVDPDGQGAVAIDGSGYRWPNSVIPYVITAGHPEKADIEWAINHVNTKTNLCLVPRTNQTDYIQFVTGSGCASYVGRQGGKQNITIGGCSQGSVAHEILHSAGLWHEQSREDRDSYITINWANIQSGYSSNFNKHVSDGIDIGTYDYGSIMHYQKLVFL
ncbi:MAG: M12 family metallopeptidase, partial [Ferruginibacter sp.]